MEYKCKQHVAPSKFPYQMLGVDGVKVAEAVVKYDARTEQLSPDYEDIMEDMGQVSLTGYDADHNPTRITTMLIEAVV